jgi:hypothetical protein
MRRHTHICQKMELKSRWTVPLKMGLSHQTKFAQKWYGSLCPSGDIQQWTFKIYKTYPVFLMSLRSSEANHTQCLLIQCVVHLRRLVLTLAIF